MLQVNYGMFRRHGSNSLCLHCLSTLIECPVHLSSDSKIMSSSAPGHTDVSPFRTLARETEGIDVEVYHRFDRDPLTQIFGLGPATARIGLFGRDPGREEVRHGEPFIGTGGQLVRKTL